MRSHQENGGWSHVTQTKQVGVIRASAALRMTIQGGRRVGTAEELLNKLEKRVPRGLKSARPVKNKRLGRWPEGQLYR
jgi:hypothetical protein